MIKNYVLDTNVILQDADSIFNFEDNHVIIPIGVIEEIDRFKKDGGELGRNARKVSRNLDSLRGSGDLKDGVNLENGGQIRVSYNGNLNSFYKESNVDLHVIHIAQETKKKEPDTPCVIVSRDVNVRIRANALGLDAEDYEYDKVEEHEINCGFTDLIVEQDVVEEILNSPCVSSYKFGDLFKNYSPNHYFYLKSNDEDSERNSCLAKMGYDGATIFNTCSHQHGFTVKPKNREQAFVLDALFDENIDMVAISGKAGTGKTLLSVAASHYMVEEVSKYDKLIVSRPIYPMGKDLGYLPGDINEKLDPWMTPIYDAFEVIIQNKKIDGRRYVAESHKIKLEPLSYIRGRSINNQIIIVDEAQNLTPLEIKTIVTRVGSNSKIIFTGDIDQIDNPYIDKYSNGLTALIEAFENSSLAAHIIMTHGVRSALAEEATELM